MSEQELNSLIEQNEYFLGQWNAFNRVLIHLSGLNTNLIDKRALYNEIVSWRPEKRKGTSE